MEKRAFEFYAFRINPNEKSKPAGPKIITQWILGNEIKIAKWWDYNDKIWAIKLQMKNLGHKITIANEIKMSKFEP